MVFPALISKLDPGTITQFSLYSVLCFSLLLKFVHRLWKLVVLAGAIVIGLTLIFSKANAAMGGPGVCGTSCMANRQYYGTPYGMNYYYPYPMLPFHSVYGPTPYYFRPYAPSPYQPYNCIECMQRYQMFTSPMSFQGMTYQHSPSLFENYASIHF